MSSVDGRAQILHARDSLFQLSASSSVRLPALVLIQHTKAFIGAHVCSFTASAFSLRVAMLRSMSEFAPKPSLATLPLELLP